MAVKQIYITIISTNSFYFFFFFNRFYSIFFFFFPILSLFIQHNAGNTKIK